MSDIKTTFIDMGAGMDYAVGPHGLDEDDGLETAVILSLFTDRLAGVDDAIPGGSTDRRGWWADAYPDVVGDKIGSRLWLLQSSKQLIEVLNPVKDYAEESLQWMIDDGIAKSVTATAMIVRDGVLGLVVEIQRATDTKRYRFDNFWSA